MRGREKIHTFVNNPPPHSVRAEMLQNRRSDISEVLVSALVSVLGVPDGETDLQGGYLAIIQFVSCSCLLEPVLESVGGNGE